MQVFCVRKIFNGAWYFDLNEINITYPFTAMRHPLANENMQNENKVFVLLIRIKLK